MVWINMNRFKSNHWPVRGITYHWRWQCTLNKQSHPRMTLLLHLPMLWDGAIKYVLHIRPETYFKGIYPAGEINIVKQQYWLNECQAYSIHKTYHMHVGIDTVLVFNIKLICIFLHVCHSKTLQWIHLHLNERDGYIPLITIPIRFRTIPLQCEKCSFVSLYCTDNCIVMPIIMHDTVLRFESVVVVKMGRILCIIVFAITIPGKIR